MTNSQTAMPITESESIHSSVQALPMKFWARAMSEVRRDTMLPDRFVWKNDSDSP